MKKYSFLISFLTSMMVGLLVFTGCTPEDDGGDEELFLALALLSQPGTFAPTTPAFALRAGEQAFYSPGPWGEAETALNVANLTRETAMDVTITLTNASGYAYFTAGAAQNLTIRNGLAFMRLEAGGIKEILQKNESFSATANLPAGPTASAKPTQSANFALAPGTAKTFCLEIHRKAKTKLTVNKVEGHLIAWNKPCEQLTTADRGSYVWDVVGEVLEGFTVGGEVTNSLVSLAGVGYVTKDAVVTVKPFTRKFGTAGSVR